MNSSKSDIIPVVLFAYARPDHLRRTLDSLRENQVPLIYAFSDGPKTQDKQEAVSEVRRILHGIDWTDVKIIERAENLGLGVSVRSGITAVLSVHDAAIVFEDDIICVPGTYKYMTAALKHYRNDTRVMSIAGWTHPSVIPSDVKNVPYFDGHACCWGWGTWARAWNGVNEHRAIDLVIRSLLNGKNVYKYGKDLLEQASYEIKKNVWAVRWLYWHVFNGGLCLRPPHSMVEHIGFDLRATNAIDGSFWQNPPLLQVPEIPAIWPEPVENSECSNIWRKACGEFKGIWDIALLKVIIRLLQATMYKNKNVQLKLK